MKHLKGLMAVSIMVVIAMLFSLAACTGKKEPAATDGTSKAVESSVTETEAEKIDPMGKYEPGIEVSSIAILDDSLKFENNESYDNNIWMKGYENDLGIKVKWKYIVPSSQAEQKISISIASNDLPDIIPALNLRIVKKLAETGVSYDLTKTVEDYASPFTKEMFAADSNTALSQVTINGKVVAIPRISGNADAGHMIYIRADWLKNVGMELPKTMDDLLKIAEAFAKNDPDKNGKNDTYGIAVQKELFEGMAMLEGFFAAYHAYPQSMAADAWVNDSSGKLANGSIQPEVKTALSKLAELYRNGILDKEFAVKDQAKVAEDMTAGRVGILFAPNWLPFYPLPDSVKNNPNADWKAIPLVSADSQPVKHMVNGSINITNVVPCAYVINKNMKNPEAAMKFYNYFYAKDCALSKDYNEEYHQNPKDNSVARFKYAVMASFYPQQSISIYRGVKQYLQDKDESKLNPWIKSNAENSIKFLAGDKTMYSSYNWAGPEGTLSVCDYYVTNDLYVKNGYVKADTESMSEKGATLKKLRLESFYQIIMGTAPIDEFDKYVENWKKLGGDKITEEINSIK